jgi:hypothetical protein
MNDENDRENSYEVSEKLSSGLHGERRVQRLIQRGRSDRISSKIYNLRLLLEIPSRFSDALIEGLLYMTAYSFLASLINELFKHPDTINLVLFILFLFVLVPVFIAIYAISQLPQLFWGVFYRLLFTIVGILFGAIL